MIRVYFLLLNLAWASRVPTKIQKNDKIIKSYLIYCNYGILLEYSVIFNMGFSLKTKLVTVRGKVHQFWTYKTLANEFVWVYKGQNYFYVMWMMPNHWPDTHLWPKTTKSSSYFQWRINKPNWELKQKTN